MPRPKVFTVGLSAADREFLVKLTTTGVHPARMIMRSRVLLELDENAGPVPDQVVVAARALTSTTTVRVVARRFAETGGDILATIGRKARQTPPVAPTVTGDVEARLVALACSAPPEGRKAWTLRLLADKLVELEVVEAVSPETVRQALKKTR